MDLYKLYYFYFLEIDAQSIETSSFIQESIVLSKEVCTKDILLLKLVILKEENIITIVFRINHNKINIIICPTNHQHKVISFIK